MKDFLKGLKVNYTASALVCVVVGLVLLIWPGTTTQIVCMILGLALLIYGAVQVFLYLASKERNMISQGMMLLGVSQAITLKKNQYDGWWIACLMGILTVALGAVLIYNPFSVVNTVVRLIGIFLIYDGLSDMWIISRVFQVKKGNGRVVDVEGNWVEEEK